MDKATAIETHFTVSAGAGEVSALLLKTDNPRAMLVFAHGAGAGMKHPFMTAVCERLAARGIATFRYQFPYMENKTRRPDPKPILYSTVRAAVEAAWSHVKGVPLFAGGKSMGGRMTSQAQAEKELDGVSGLVFFGFPLHPPGKPSIERAEHLGDVGIPMLFLQGTRDTLAGIELIQTVTKKLGRRATLYIVDGADHSFHVLKSSGRNDDEALDEIVARADQWMTLIAGRAVQGDNTGRP
jgi:uncharacterized protein